MMIPIGMLTGLFPRYAKTERQRAGRRLRHLYLDAPAGELASSSYRRIAHLISPGVQIGENAILQIARVDLRPCRSVRAVLHRIGQSADLPVGRIIVETGSAGMV